MNGSYLDLTRLTLGLGSDWEIDKALLDEQIQQTDIHISHSRSALVCPRRGRQGFSMIIGKRGHGATWISMNQVFCSLSGSRDQVFSGCEDD